MISEYLDRILASALSVATWAQSHAQPALSSRYFLFTAALVVLAIVLTMFVRWYRAWQGAWLSQLIEQRLRAMRRTRRVSRRAPTTLGFRTPYRSARFFVFRSIGAVERYLRYSFVTDAKSFHIPSVTSFVLTAVFIFGFFVVPHPFKDFSDVFHPSQWWHVLTTDVSAWDPVSKVFKSLFVVVIALIVFVAK